MARLGFYIDIDTCIGCRTCQVACCDKNNLDVGTLFRTVHTYETGEYPNAKMYHYSAACNHCENPKCLSVCPTGAIFKAEDGTVQYAKNLCTACNSCVRDCPYSVPKIVPETGCMGKCDGCRDLRMGGQNPVCVDACLMRCLHWGDLDELETVYGPGLVKDIPALPSSATTNPSLLIKTKVCALETAFEEKSV